MTCFGAEDEARTRDPNLGKVVLYQLSYFRIFPFFSFGIAKVGIFSLPPNFFCNFFRFFLHFYSKCCKISRFLGINPAISPQKIAKTLRTTPKII